MDNQGLNMNATDSTSAENFDDQHISIITVCKNRLHHLRQTLPYMTSQSNTEVIVVDYGCSQGTAAWVNHNYPQVHVVKVNDDPGFNVSRGRNLGAAEARGKWLFFVDADIFLHRDLGLWAQQEIRCGHYYRAPPTAGVTTWGTFLCARSDFVNAVGFDEAFCRWGGEDVDLYQRFDQVDLKVAPFPDNAIASIKHGDDERQLGKAPNRAVLVEATRIYMLAKRDITSLLGRTPGLEERKALMNMIDEKVLEFACSGRSKQARMEIQITHGINQQQKNVMLKRFLVYVLEFQPEQI